MVENCYFVSDDFFQWYHNLFLILSLKLKLKAIELKRDKSKNSIFKSKNYKYHSTHRNLEVGSTSPTGFWKSKQNCARKLFSWIFPHHCYKSRCLPLQNFQSCYDPGFYGVYSRMKSVKTYISNTKALIITKARTFVRVTCKLYT